MTCRHCGARLYNRPGSSGRYALTTRADGTDTLGSGSECPANEEGHEVAGLNHYEFRPISDGTGVQVSQSGRSTLAPAATSTDAPTSPAPATTAAGNRSRPTSARSCTPRSDRPEASPMAQARQHRTPQRQPDQRRRPAMADPDSYDRYRQDGDDMTDALETGSDELQPPGSPLVPWGAMHLRAANPRTTAPTGECGTNGFELRVTDDLALVDCRVCLLRVKQGRVGGRVG